jgi:zinc transport system substrate-binding protein
VNTIRDGLAKADPAHAGQYIENAAAYNQQLVSLDQQFTAGLKECAQRTIVVSHRSMAYLAARYHLEVEAISGLSPESEPSTARLAELSDIVKRKGITYVFFESLTTPRLADAIAAESGAKTLVLDPIEGLTDEDQKAGKDYIRVQQDNLKNLRHALSCQ